MRTLKTNLSILILLTGMITCSLCGCKHIIKPSEEFPNPKVGSTRMNDEIARIDSLLRDLPFSEFMARSLDSAYYAGIGQPQPVFLLPSDSTTIQLIRKKDETIAISIASFYALECGIEYLIKKSSQTFVGALDKIAKGQAGSEAGLLLNRFANATWKAGQPFRDLERINRYNFVVASLLPTEEVAKDSIQIVNTSKKILSLMTPVASASLDDQMKFLRSLLQDTTVAAAVSYYVDSTYAVSQGQTPPAFNPNATDTATSKKTVRQIKIATNVAGYYALECGLNYVVTIRKVYPSQILRSMVDNSLSKDDILLFARFANATWKAGQPFRGLSRITRDTFTPFYFLSDADIDKDVVQIRAAAKILLNNMGAFSKP